MTDYDAKKDLRLQYAKTKYAWQLKRCTDVLGRAYAMPGALCGYNAEGQWIEAGRIVRVSWWNGYDLIYTLNNNNRELYLIAYHEPGYEKLLDESRHFIKINQQHFDDVWKKHFESWFDGEWRPKLSKV